VQLVTSGFPMISLTLDPPLEAIHAGFHIYLRVGRWDTFINTLKASSLEVLEINHHGNSVAFFNNWHRPGDRHHYLWEGLKSIEEKAGDVFEFRTWDGATSRKGLIQGAECYAVVRKATGQQGGTGAGTADGTAGDGQHVPLDIGDGDDSSGKGLS